MSLSDCEKCWDTPCTCGWDYRNWEKEKIIEFFTKILKYHKDDKDVILNNVTNNMNKKRHCIDCSNVKYKPSNFNLSDYGYYCILLKTWVNSYKFSCHHDCPIDNGMLF